MLYNHLFPPKTLKYVFRFILFTFLSIGISKTYSFYCDICESEQCVCDEDRQQSIEILGQMRQSLTYISGTSDSSILILNSGQKSLADWQIVQKRDEARTSPSKGYTSLQGGISAPPGHFPPLNRVASQMAASTQNIEWPENSDSIKSSETDSIVSIPESFGSLSIEGASLQSPENAKVYSTTGTLEPDKDKASVSSSTNRMSMTPLRHPPSLHKNQSRQYHSLHAERYALEASHRQDDLASVPPQYDKTYTKDSRLRPVLTRRQVLPSPYSSLPPLNHLLSDPLKQNREYSMPVAGGRLTEHAKTVGENNEESTQSYAASSDSSLIGSTATTPDDVVTGSPATPQYQGQLTSLPFSSTLSLHHSLPVNMADSYSDHVKSEAPPQLSAAASLTPPYIGRNQGYSLSTMSSLTQQHQTVSLDPAGASCGEYRAKLHIPLSEDEFQTRGEELKQMQRVIRRLEDQMKRELVKNNDSTSNQQMQILTKEDCWELADENPYTYELLLKGKCPADLEKRVNQKIFERACTLTIDEETPSKVYKSTEKPSEKEIELHKSYDHFYEKLMKLTGRMSLDREAALLTGTTWNPYALRKTRNVPLDQLIQFFTGFQRTQSDRACDDQTVKKLLLLTNNDKEPGYQEITVANRKAYRERTNSNEISFLYKHLSQMPCAYSLSLLHLKTADKEYHHTILIMSDASNRYWFGSEHLGGYDCSDTLQTATTVSELMALCSVVFDVAHYTVYTRYISQNSQAF